MIVGNLNEDGYLIASDDELMGVTPPAAPEVDAAAQENVLEEAEALGLDATLVEDEPGSPEFSADWANPRRALSTDISGVSTAAAVAPAPEATAAAETVPVAAAYAGASFAPDIPTELYVDRSARGA